jgi:putative thioredoxin
MSVSPYIIDVGRNTFQDAVLNNSRKGPVLVNYWTRSAGPCLRLWPVLEKLANDYAGKFLLANINTDEDAALAKEYGVNSVPTVKLFIDGEVVEQLHGYDSGPELRKIIDRHVARASDAELAQAINDYQQGDVEQAFEQLNKLVLLDPENDRILLAYAKLLMREQAFEQACNLLRNTSLVKENAEAGILMANALFISTAHKTPDEASLVEQLATQPLNLDLQFQLCSHRVMRSEYTEALALLLSILKQDRRWNDGIALNCLHAVFNMLGKDEPIVQKYRKLLSDLNS